MERKCVECGKLFKIFKSRTRNGRGRFCSKPCSNKNTPYSRNKYINNGSTTEIIFKDGRKSLIDSCEYEKIKHYHWYINAAGYACSVTHMRNLSKRHSIQLHGLIIGTPKSKVTDHINHDRLDNRKSNLRICTRHENSMNRRSVIGSSSKYLGVKANKKYGTWTATVKLNGNGIFLGYFHDEDMAAKAYNKGAVKYFGEFANLNIIEGDKE